MGSATFTCTESGFCVDYIYRESRSEGEVEFRYVGASGSFVITADNILVWNDNEENIGEDMEFTRSDVVAYQEGDVNDDGTFSVVDVILFQKWLLAVPDTHLDNWKAADMYNDDILNVVDLCLMKRALLKR